jgi:hypothetical protein
MVNLNKLFLAFHVCESFMTYCLLRSSRTSNQRYQGKKQTIEYRSVKQNELVAHSVRKFQTKWQSLFQDNRKGLT